MILHKKIAFSVVSLACALVMWQAMKNTCPPKEQHLQAVTSVVEKAVDKIFEERIQVPEESRQLAEYLSKNIIPQAVAKLTANKIDFTSLGVFSIGTLEGENVPVSLGVFGQVFTIGEDRTYEYLNNMIDENEINKILQNLNTEEDGKEQTTTDEGE